ncbi:MAG: hypothetical protein IPG50_25325 [Myxococcales bacterium]|nr:hypothetical protein [Myxococcales bacterium]
MRSRASSSLAAQLLASTALAAAGLVWTAPSAAQVSTEPPPGAATPGPSPASEPMPGAPGATGTPAAAPARYDLPPAEAEPAPQGPTARDRVVAYYTGLQLGISPGIIIPTNGGDPGFLLSLYGGYGIEAGSTVIIPGIRATGAWPSGEFIGTVLPGAKVVFPVGAFAPYVEGGVGPGYVSVGQKTGLALRAGLGFSVHPSSRFAIGLGAAYETITGTGVSWLGPVLILSF